MSVLDGDLEERAKAIDNAASAAQSLEPKRRGRPAGSKNKPKDDEKERVRQRLAGVILAVFQLFGFVGSWLGYEYDPKLTSEEAAEGAVHFEPLAERYPRIIAIAGWIGAPIWLLTKMTEKFHRRREKAQEKPNANQAGQVTGRDAGGGELQLDGGSGQGARIAS